MVWLSRRRLRGNTCGDFVCPRDIGTPAARDHRVAPGTKLTRKRAALSPFAGSQRSESGDVGSVRSLRRGADDYQQSSSWPEVRSFLIPGFTQAATYEFTA